MPTHQSMEHLGDTRASANHDRDLVHELSKRLDSVWRYDQFIANAEGKEELQELWQDLKDQDTANVERLKRAIKREIEAGCF